VWIKFQLENLKSRLCFEELEHYFKTNPKAVGFLGVDWIYVARHSLQWRSHVNMVMDLALLELGKFKQFINC